MKYYSFFKKAIKISFFRCISMFVKRNEKMIAFGSWDGKLYSDNSKYLLEECLKQLDHTYRFIWIGKKELQNVMPKDDRIEVCEKDRFSTVIKLLRCKYIISSQLASIDISSVYIFWNAKLILLYHGFPIKKIGADIKKNGESKSHISYDYFLSSSRIHTNNLLSAFRNIGCREDKILPYGTPRNDFLFNLTETNNTEVISKFKNQYGISSDKKIILYMPTFRKSGKATESLWFRKNESEQSAMLELLKNYNYVLVEKNHFVEQQRNNGAKESRAEYYINLKSDFDSQELLACADILISDYSSALIDYLLLNRPIIHYVYDYEFYRVTDSGLYFDIEDFACGAVAKDFVGLVQVLDEIITKGDKYEGLRNIQKKRFLEYEEGTSASNIINNVLI